MIYKSIIKKLFKKFLMDLLSDDKEVQMKVTEVANPDLAYSIKHPDRKPPKPPGWWKKPY